MSLHHSNADVEGEIIRIGRTDLPTIRYHSIKTKHGGAAANNYINFTLHNGGSGGGYTEQTEVLRIVGNGRVGIGTEDPQGILDITGNRQGTSIDMDGAFKQDGSMNWNFAQHQWIRSASNTNATKIVSILAAGDNAADTNLYNNINFLARTSSNFGAASTSRGIGVSLEITSPNDIRFGTNTEERLRITSAGKMGLGTGNNDPVGGDFVVENTTGTAGVALSRVFSGNVASSAVNTPSFAFTMSDTATNDQVVASISPQALAGTGDAFKGHIRVFTANTAGTNTERLRITSDGDVAIGRETAQANYAAGTATTRLAVTKDAAGSGYHEIAHFTAGSDSNDTGAIVRITQFSNDRGLYIKSGRGTSDQAKAIFGLRTSSAADQDVMTFIQGGYVGINTTSPSGRLNLVGSDSQILNIVQDTGDLTIRMNDRGSSSAYIKLPDGTGELSFEANGGEKLRLRSDAATGGIYVPPGTDGYGKIELQNNAIGGLRVGIPQGNMSNDLKCPRKGFIMAITSFTTYDTYPQPGGTGFVYVDVGASKNIIVMQVTGTGGTLLGTGNAAHDSSVSSFTDGKITVQPGSTAQGTFRIVNRTSNDYTFTCTFL